MVVFYNFVCVNVVYLLDTKWMPEDLNTTNANNSNGSTSDNLLHLPQT